MVLLSDVGPNAKYSVNNIVKYLKAVDCYNEEQDMICRQLLAGINL